MLSVERVSKRWGNRAVLADVSLRCGPAEIVVVLGENGAGKSSLLAVVAGLVRPERGSVTLCGEEITCGSVRGRSHLGVLPDHADLLPELAVGELVALTAALKRAPAPADELRETLGLSPVWGQRLGTLSFGQKKRALLLSALVGDPWLLLLDEPSNGLDPDAVLKVRELLRARRERGQGALVATNDLAFAGALAARVLRLEAGTLVDV